MSLFPSCLGIFRPVGGAKGEWERTLGMHMMKTHCFHVWSHQRINKGYSVFFFFFKKPHEMLSIFYSQVIPRGPILLGASLAHITPASSQAPCHMFPATLGSMDPSSLPIVVSLHCFYPAGLWCAYGAGILLPGAHMPGWGVCWSFRDPLSLGRKGRRLGLLSLRDGLHKKPRSGC